MMVQNEFNELCHAAAALSPTQMQQLRDELDRRLAIPAVGPLDRESQSATDLFWGLMRDDAEVMDEVVADAYRHRQESGWRELDL